MSAIRDRRRRKSREPLGESSSTAHVSGGRVFDCGIAGIQAVTFTSSDRCTVNLANVTVMNNGVRANLANPLEGHGVAFEASQGDVLSGRVENCTVSGNFQDGVFAWIHDMVAGGSGLVTVQSNEIAFNVRTGVNLLTQSGSTLSPSSTIFSNRIHHNGWEIHNVADGSGATSSPSIVNNLIYRNTTNGILNEALQAGSVAGPTMTHNTVAETGGIGVLVQGVGNTTGASFWNGISYHLASPGPTDLSGFAANQINFSNFQFCTGACSGTLNITNQQPLFMSVAVDNYHLVANEATNSAVDKATNTPPAVPQFDFEGNLRQIDLNSNGPVGAYADMGADEAP